MDYDDQEDLEEELLTVAGRSAPGGSKKRTRRAAESSDEDYVEEERQTRKKASVSRRKTKGMPPAAEGSEEVDSDFDDGYGSDLMGDEEDRARLAAMNELEREMELADRAERRDTERERRRTARMLSQQQQRTTAKAGTMRSSTRQRGMDTAKKSAMAELVAAKNARARKTSKEEEKCRRKKDEDAYVSDESEYEVSDRSERGVSPEDEAPSSLEYSRDRRRDEDLSEDGLDREEEEEDGVITRQVQPDEESEDAEYKNIKDIQVRRHMLEKWHNEPFFERSLPGAVVRIAVGSNRYFMAQIIHVEEREPGMHKDPGIYKMQSPYQFPADEKAAGKTNKWLYVQRGTSPRMMPMTLISNHTITEEEFRGWNVQCQKDNRPLITMAEVAEVKEKLQKASTYVYTAEDVAKMVEEKRNRGNVRNFAKEKSRLVVQRAKALEDGNEEEAERLSGLINELDLKVGQRAQREQERLDKDRDKDKGKKSLAEVNKQNALRNMENALKNVTSRPEGSRALNADGVDPFSRRQTRPMNYWSTKRRTDAAASLQDGDVADVPEDAMMADLDADAPTATATENEAGGIDLNIDLSALQESPATPLLTARLLGPNWAAGLPSRSDFVGRKTLTLTDYKRRQGIV